MFDTLVIIAGVQEYDAAFRAEAMVGYIPSKSRSFVCAEKDG